MMPTDSNADTNPLSASGRVKNTSTPLRNASCWMSAPESPVRAMTVVGCSLWERSNSRMRRVDSRPSMMGMDMSVCVSLGGGHYFRGEQSEDAPVRIHLYSLGALVYVSMASRPLRAIVWGWFSLVI